MASVLLTGFPGFLASALLPRLIERSPSGTAFDCLVERRFQTLAEQRISYMPGAHRSRVRIRPGDITLPGVGLTRSASDEIRAECTEAYHFAAVYDLGVKRNRAYAVNVDGTRNVLEFMAGARGLQHFHHVSTCYVSGNYVGRYHEADLDVGQGFNNYYDETKFISERIVQDNLLSGCAVTIYRPSIVAGNSATGAAPKCDGLYFFIQWVLAQPRWATLWPRIADASRHTLNVVPSNYVVDTISELSTRSKAGLSVYQVCDPNPPTIARILELLGSATGSRILPMPLPTPVARTAVRLISTVHPTLDIPPEAIGYLAHPAEYDASNTVRDLAGTGVSLPDVADYLPRMVQFVRSKGCQQDGNA